MKIRPARPKALPKKDERPLESEVEAKVCQYAKSLGFYVRKFVSPAHRSVPDRYFIAPVWDSLATQESARASLHRRLFKIEFKRLGEKPTFSQACEHKELRAFGVFVFVTDNVEDGKHLINLYRNWEKSEGEIERIHQRHEEMGLAILENGPVGR